MEQTKTMIRLTVPDLISNEEIAELISDIKESKPEVVQVRPEPYAAMEWIIPTAVGAYLAKPYFDSFLGEAGKDHYTIVKEWTKKLAQYTRKKIKTKILTSSGSELNFDEGYTQSSAISIFIELSNNKRLKLLFDLTLSDTEWNKAIDNFYILLADHYEHYPNDGLTVKTDSLNGRFCYGVIDKRTLEWIFLDESGMYKRMSNLAQ